MATQEIVTPNTSFGEDNQVQDNARTNGARPSTPEKLAGALGWFSIGLGLTEIVAPRALSKFIGVPKQTTTMRLMGLRELAAGVGILATRRSAPWLWARVGGGVMDMAALAGASRKRRSDSKRLTAAMGAVAGVTVLDALCAKQMAKQNANAGDDRARFTASVSINRSPEECYGYWHDIEKLPTFLKHLKSVQATGGGRSHWVAKGPGGKEFAWDAEVTEDRPNELIAWRSLEGSDFPNSGRVRFERAPGGRGTIVRVLMDYELPPRVGGPFVTTILGADPGQRVRKDLLRFKQLLEAGEIATTEGQPAGRRDGATWIDRLARV